MSTTSINASCGNTSAGSITQLVAQGSLDTYLSANASHTYWRMKYNRYTPFSLESVIQPFNSAVQFGHVSTITLNRTGDLISNLFLLVELPGITACKKDADDTCGGQIAGDRFPSMMKDSNAEADNLIFASYLNENDLGDEPNTCEMAKALLTGKRRWAKDKYGSCANVKDDDTVCNAWENPCDDSTTWAHWSNSIGQLLVKQCAVIIGGSTVDTLYSDFLWMWEELSGKSGKRLTEMIGKRYSRQQLINDSRSARILYVPLPFYFSQHSGQALSLASLQFHSVQVSVEFERLEHCIITSCDNVLVKNCQTSACMTKSDLSAALETTYVYLEKEERGKFSKNSFEQLITQVQQYSITSSAAQVRIPLNFNHPCLELLFAIRRHSSEKANDWFNYSGIDGRDPLVKAALYLNNQPRFQNKPGTWLRMVQPYLSHTNIPESFIYCYSFALHPEQPEPSGSCNFSRIDHVDLVLNLQEGLGREQVTILIYARNWNVLRFREGMAGVAFAS